MKKFPGFLCIIALCAVIAGAGCSSSKSSPASSSSKDITAFSINGVNGTITGSSIALTLPHGTDKSALTPTIAIDGASVSPVSGVAKDFTNPVTYTVTAADASTQAYTVTVTVASIGTKTTYTLGGVSFSTIQTTENTLGSGITFPTGTDDSTTATITTPFVMAETLTTYELWSTVKTWATSHGYTFANDGQMGSDSSGSANTAGGAQQPVTAINWRDAMIWCNALTEYYNANNGTDPDLDCVYYTNSTYTTPLRTSTNSNTPTYTTAGTQDDPYIKASSTGNVDMSHCTAKGFRLPSSNEYEYAARYIGTTFPSNSNYVLRNGVYYYKGNSASGATAACTDKVATSLVAVWEFNYTTVSTYTLVTTTAVVTSKTANAFGLHDMSGNAWEWCFDWYPGYVGSYRVIRGGSFDDLAGVLRVGYVYFLLPYEAYYYYGFRFSRTK